MSSSAGLVLGTLQYKNWWYHSTTEKLEVNTGVELGVHEKFCDKLLVQIELGLTVSLNKVQEIRVIGI